MDNKMDPPNIATNGAFTKSVGRTIDRFEYGRGPRTKRSAKAVHHWEYLRLYFTDGSMLDISTGSNAAQVAEEHHGLTASDFAADLMAIFHKDGARAGPPV